MGETIFQYGDPVFIKKEGKYAQYITSFHDSLSLQHVVELNSKRVAVYRDGDIELLTEAVL